MRYASTLGIVVLGCIVTATPLHGQNPIRYRNFQLGGDLRTVSALTGVAASEAKSIHVRPALMQELEWRRGYSEAAVADSVQQIVFSFYNDQLTKLVVDYDRERTTGLTDADMIEAISMTYGQPLNLRLKGLRPAASTVEVESGSPISRWGDADYSVVLFRTPYAGGFRLIVTSTKLEALARTADVQAIRLDDQEAPQRELARQKKEADDARATDEQARILNKTAFKP